MQPASPAAHHARSAGRTHGFLRDAEAEGWFEATLRQLNPTATEA